MGGERRKRMDEKRRGMERKGKEDSSPATSN